MTVRQLIAFLETQDPNAEIVWDAGDITDNMNLPALILNSIKIDKISGGAFGQDDLEQLEWED